MTNCYKSYQDKYTYCKPNPKYEYKDYDENKCKKIFKRKCDCPVNTTISEAGDFSLECGSSLKIFESDEPVEMSMEVESEATTNEDLCNLKVKVLLQNGNVLEFNLPNPNLTSGFDENGISFYSKNVCEVILECESDSGVRCEGFWRFTLPLRGSAKDFKCECPENRTLFRGTSFTLECGSSLMLFQSDEPVETMFGIELREFPGQQDSCDLKVIAELANGDTLEFNIPAPIITQSFDRNRISFYSKNLCKVTIECKSDSAIGCDGFWNQAIILRGSRIED